MSLEIVSYLIVMQLKSHLVVFGKLTNHFSEEEERHFLTFRRNSFAPSRFGSQQVLYVHLGRSIDLLIRGRIENVGRMKSSNSLLFVVLGFY